ncbi:MAG TPA: XRE family transcriptional regulator [Syntrophorhabdaceae bacterium]|nr:XRE family transcriptional regulator [Syntrophorhabdaceae bacterium]
MDEQLISKNIKKYRLNRGLSLEQLARLCNLTKGYVSKIENSEKAPPFSTLIRIAAALGVDVNLFFTEDADMVENAKFCIVRKGEGKEVLTRGTLYGYKYETLAQRKPGKNMEPYIFYPVKNSEAMFSHEGEEFQYVLEGIHEFTYGDETYTLYEGDSIYFDSLVPHSGRSIGKQPAKILAIIYSYKRQSHNS